MSIASRRIADLLDNADLPGALDAVKAALKTGAADHDLRHLYIDLLILDGDYQKADSQCELAVRFQPEDALGFALLRRQIRAMEARKAWFETGAVPDFPGGPTQCDTIALKLNLALKEGAGAEATALLAELDEQRGEVPVSFNGKSVSDVRDLDDRIPHALEVLTDGGAYLWVDFARVAAIAVQPIRRPRDMAFRPAELTLESGAEAAVLLPALYYGADASAALKLGHETEWLDLPGGLVAGLGQRCLLAGEDLVSFHDIERLEAQSAAEKQAAHG
ncbi:type VI secretion system accessory protein TagJ [Allorhizobium taibaishanense]|uniref:Nitrogen fixation protein n=1 Tax=Allorhizobium taibaishanense TaxID=887144 RepID=A0A1Q9A9X3_9HYPH|nr:type VI secretion system accessory protein TagJ [Allorhizobium taibaishanense]MBB4010023.1 type VI secretion system protein ImpE [Allorhizobium taibaishanense]OLP51634.1 nitrogen fixation protein [Allorhizobium taibaishanense]